MPALARRILFALATTGPVIALSGSAPAQTLQFDADVSAPTEISALGSHTVAGERRLVGTIFVPGIGFTPSILGPTGWERLPGDPDTFVASPLMVSFDGDLYTGRTVTPLGFPHVLGRLDATGWTVLGASSGFFEMVDSLDVLDLGDGEALYVGGSFLDVGAPGTRSIARYDGQTFSSVGGGVTSPPSSFSPKVEEIACWDDGTGRALYAAGVFSSAGGVPVNNIARFDGTTWSPLGQGLVGPSAKDITGFVRGMAAVATGSDRRLVVAGRIEQAGGAPGGPVVAWDGSRWEVWSTDTTDGQEVIDVFGLTTFDPDGRGQRLYASAVLRDVNDVVSVQLLQWNGARWEPLGGPEPVPGNTVVYANHFHVADLGTGRALHIGGSFSRYAGIDVEGLVRLTAPVGDVVGVPTCPAAPDGLGREAVCRASGSPSIAANDLTLHLRNAPPGSTAVFLVGTEGVFTPGGSAPTCVGGTTLRVLPTGRTDASGSLETRLDLLSLQPIPVEVGATLFVQAAYRDPVLSVSTSDGLRIELRP